MQKFTLTRQNTSLVIIDIQERLASVMKVKDGVIKNTNYLIELAKIFAIPIIVTEQYKKGLGSTVPEIAQNLPAEARYVQKITFSCCDEPTFNDVVALSAKTHLVLVGMEAHICVLQTALGLMQQGKSVHIVSDAVCSRAKTNYKTALALLRDAGAVITSTETVLFQILQTAGTEEFKRISKLIK